MENTLKIKVFRKSILFCKYLRNGSSDLYEILCGGQFLSCKLKFQISWTSVCKCARTRWKRAHSRYNVHARVFNSCTRIYSWILMKFETYIHKIVKNHQMIFRIDPCTHARTRDVNVCARVLSRWNARAQTYASCAHIYARFFTKNHMMIPYYLMNTCLKFHKDPCFRCGDICITILTFKNHQFSMFFAYFHIFAPPKSSQMDNYWIIVKFFWN